MMRCNDVGRTWHGIGGMERERERLWLLLLFSSLLLLLLLSPFSLSLSFFLPFFLFSRPPVAGTSIRHFHFHFPLPPLTSSPSLVQMQRERVASIRAMEIGCSSAHAAVASRKRLMGTRKVIHHSSFGACLWAGRRGGGGQELLERCDFRDICH
jgi:hypothetical protein